MLRIFGFFEFIANYDTMTQRKLKENVDEYLNVEKLTHGFGRKSHFNDVSSSIKRGNISDLLSKTV